MLGPRGRSDDGASLALLLEHDSCEIQVQTVGLQVLATFLLETLCFADVSWANVPFRHNRLLSGKALLVDRQASVFPNIWLEDCPMKVSYNIYLYK